MHNPSAHYLYVAVRIDLPFAQQAVQAAHAAMESVRRFPQPDVHPNLVLLGVNDAKALRKLLTKLSQTDIPHVSWEDPDLELPDPLMAIATAALSSPRNRRFFSHYQLLKGAQHVS